MACPIFFPVLFFFIKLCPSDTYFMKILIYLYLFLLEWNIRGDGDICIFHSIGKSLVLYSVLFMEIPVLWMTKWKPDKKNKKWQLFLYSFVRTPLTKIPLAGSDNRKSTVGNLELLISTTLLLSLSKCTNFANIYSSAVCLFHIKMKKFN